MKLLFRLFLSLCFFLSSGYSYLHANRYQDHIGYAPVKFLAKPGHNTPGISEKIPDFHVRFNSTVSEKATDQLLDSPDTEDDDNEPSSKKHAAVGNHFTSFFPSRTSSYYCSYLRTGLSFHKHFSYSSSEKHILFRVIRV